MLFGLTANRRVKEVVPSNGKLTFQIVAHH